MAVSYIPAIPIILELEEPKQVGIPPFLTMPEVVVYQNRVFIPVFQDGDKYAETTFAVAPLNLVAQDKDNLIVCLRVRSGEFVSNVNVPNSGVLPGVVRWGERIFRLSGDKVYTEAFFCIAYDLAKPGEEYG